MMATTTIVIFCRYTETREITHDTQLVAPTDNALAATVTDTQNENRIDGHENRINGAIEQ